MSLREAYEKRSKEFYRRYYQQLLGATIITYEGFTRDEYTDGDGFPMFKVRFKDGTYGLIEISRDEEGNGGGFIFGLPLPSLDDYDKRHGLNKYEKARS